jgi:hypothetical protein
VSWWQVALSAYAFVVGLVLGALGADIYVRRLRPAPRLGRPVTPAEVLEGIEELRDRGLHNILFRNAGVGLLFYEGTYDDDGWPQQTRPPVPLVVHAYYPDLTTAVAAELARLRAAARP